MGFMDRLFGGNLSLADTHLIESAVEQGVRNARQPLASMPSGEQAFIADLNTVRYKVNKHFGWPEREVVENLGALTDDQFSEVLGIVAELAGRAEIAPRNANLIRKRLHKARKTR